MRRIGDLTAGAAALVLCIFSAAPVHGQVEARPYVGAGYSDAPTVMFGFQFLNEGGSSAGERGSGPVFQAFASGGFRDALSELSAQGGAGVLWAKSGPFPAYWGPTLIASLDPGGLGAGVRLAGRADAGFIWFTAGAIHLNDAWAPHLNIDITLTVLCSATGLCD